MSVPNARDNQGTGRTKRFKPSLSTLILTSLAAGIACGLFFGDYCSRLAFAGDAFVGLLRMTVMPYIMVSLVANLGRLSVKQSRRLAMVGGAVLLLFWTLTLVTVVALANSFPKWKAGSFFSTTITDEPREFDFMALFIPSNLFESLAHNQVPAVIVLCIFVGLALSGMPNREPLIVQLDIIAKVLIRVSRFVTRLAPLGVFAIAASTAGTITLDEFSRLQAYLAAYTFGAVFLGFIALPCLVTTLTPFRYRDVIAVSKDAMVTAFATGKLIVVLPMLIERTEQLFERKLANEEPETVPAVDVLFPVAYPFPHVGKLLSILFIPFAGWFVGNPLGWDEYPSLLSTGTVSYFGGPLLAIPFLLDVMHLPHDMMQLFLLSGVYGERVGDALGAMHLAAFSLLTACAFFGRVQVQLWPLLKYSGAVIVIGISTLVGIRSMLSRTLQFVEGKEQVIAEMQLLERPVPYTVLESGTPNPDPLLPGETLLDRIRRRGIVRVGYNEDKVPFAFFNVRGELVGFDINMAHAFARDLDVTVEFVRFDRRTLARQLADDEFDVIMSGLVGTLERSEAVQHTAPYMDVTLALVVPDYRARSFRSLESLQSEGDLKIGFVDLSRGFVNRLREALPNAELVELSTNRQFFEERWKELDALLISAESGAAFTLMYPEFEVVVPSGRRVTLPLFYAVGARDAAMSSFLDHWVALRKKDGTTQEFYDHWILGKVSGNKKRRWCVIRDVLHWVE